MRSGRVKWTLHFSRKTKHTINFFWSTVKAIYKTEGHKKIGNTAFLFFEIFNAFFFAFAIQVSSKIKSAQILWQKK